MMKSLLTIAALSLTPLLASAQIYKCGNTFSEVPCAPSDPAGSNQNATTLRNNASKVLPKPPDLPARPEATARMVELCEREVRSTLKDPASATLRDTRRGGVETWCTKPQKQVRYYWLTVNAKNSYGAFVGEKPYRCAVDIGETMVIRVTQISETAALPAACSQ